MGRQREGIACASRVRATLPCSAKAGQCRSEGGNHQMRGEVAQGPPAAKRRCGKDARLWLWMGVRCPGSERRADSCSEGVCWAGLTGRREASPRKILAHRDPHLSRGVTRDGRRAKARWLALQALARFLLLFGPAGAAEFAIQWYEEVMMRSLYLRVPRFSPREASRQLLPQSSHAFIKGRKFAHERQQE